MNRRASVASLLFSLASCEAGVGGDAAGTEASSSTRGAEGDGSGVTSAPGTTSSGAGTSTESSGGSEGETTGVGDSTGGGLGPVVVTGCEPVGTVDSDGVFSLHSFGEKLLVGQFGYGREAQSMLYSFEPWQKVEPGILGVGESVCSMIDRDGWVFANTEHSGDIFRSTDGTTWERVYDGGAGFIGCDLVAHDDGYLYAVQYDYDSQTHGQILRSAGGATWEVVYDSGDSSRYLREIASHDGELLGFSIDTGTSQGYVHRSVDGTTWIEAPSPARFFRTTKWNGELWLSSTERSSNGVSGVWREQDGSFELMQPMEVPYVTALTPWRGSLFAATSDGWKDDVGNAQLWMSHDGQSWESVCGEFPEIAIWDVAVHDDRLFVGSWQFGGAGSVFEVLAR